MIDNVVHMEQEVFERFKVASENGKFSMDAELNILTYLIEKYKFINQSEYARQHNISPAGALKRIETGSVMYITIAGIKLIIP